MLYEMKNPFAEIIQSSLTNITAQCWDLDIVPTFGQCVEIQGGKTTVYALVSHMQTGSFDNVRKPSPFKKTIAQLKKEQPHIFEFLSTTFTCVPVAYTYKNALVYAIPPEPPRIHEFVVPLGTKEMLLLFGKKHFLTGVFGIQDQVGNIDELLLACIRLIHEQQPFALSYYVDLLEAYALFVGSDYRRIKLFAERLEKIL